MKIQFENYGIIAHAEIGQDSNVFEVMAAIGGLLQVIGYGKDSIEKVIKDEDDCLWLDPHPYNLQAWNGHECLCDRGDGRYGLFNLNGKTDGIVRFIPIATLCG